MMYYTSTGNQIKTRQRSKTQEDTVKLKTAKGTYRHKAHTLAKNSSQKSHHFL